MGNNKFCPLCEKCPVYIDKVYQNEMVDLTHGMLYCLQTHDRYKLCRSYQVFEKIGRIDPYTILHNSSFS